MRPFAVILDAGSSRANKTGSWRTERPSYARFLPPCNKACPAGENVQEWLSLVEQEKYEKAWREIVKHNPFPATLGRICYRSCEGACHRGKMEGAVNINAVERFLGDLALRKVWAFDKPWEPSGKKVLVIGAGAAGLSAAYHLTRLGHKVTLKERAKKPGGTMRYGIPEYRLPHAVLDAEVKKIVAYGVTLETNAALPSLAAIVAAKAFDAVFVATGAPVAKTVSFPVDPRAHVFDALAVLRAMEGEDKPGLGKRVAVYGGGNTAMDVARTARRLGACEVSIIYRRTREKMPAHAFEIEAALEEGIAIKFLTTIERFEDKKITLQKMALDDKGFPQPTGKKETMTADSVVLALGQDIDAAFLENVPGLVMKDGALVVDASMMTGCAGVFGGGDLASRDRTAATAVGHGKKAAYFIDAWLRKKTADVALKHETAAFERLNTWYYEEKARIAHAPLEREKRVASFDEIQKGFVEPEALCEARRCLSCGNCFECDNCYGFCPDNAVKKLGAEKGFMIDLDYCKGCGLCAAECPCGCIAMLPEKT